jgi:hypothetical protein
MSKRAHAFVAMPFGSKPDRNGQMVDFNRVFAEYIAPAVEAAGMTVFRADEEIRAGDIRNDMFQELLMADLVVADLTIDNPNVWYELGVRHALRARGVILVTGGEPRPSTSTPIASSTTRSRTVRRIRTSSKTRKARTARGRRSRRWSSPRWSRGRAGR